MRVSASSCWHWRWFGDVTRSVSPSFFITLYVSPCDTTKVLVVPICPLCDCVHSSIRNLANSFLNDAFFSKSAPPWRGVWANLCQQIFRQFQAAEGVRDAFGRILRLPVAAETSGAIDMKHVFSFPYTEVPLPLSHYDGTPLTCLMTDKSVLTIQDYSRVDRRSIYWEWKISLW